MEEIINHYKDMNLELRVGTGECGGMTPKQLIKFYESLGFVRKKGKDRIYNTMRREAGGA